MSDATEVDALRRSHDIVEFIGRYVELKKNGSELRGLCPFHADKKPSLTVVPGKQLWACFSCLAHEEHGADIFGFIRSYENCTFPEAIAKLKANGSLPDAKPIARPTPKKSPARTLLVPPAGDLPDMARADLGGAPAKVWTIKTPDGLPWLYEARYILDGKKETRYYTFGRSEDDPPRWECKHPAAPKPFYGLEQLAARPAAQVMIHEAPKKAEAGARLFPKLVHLGMLGGVYAPAHMDLTPLKGRRCVLLPDNDEPGRQAMRRLAPLLLAAGVTEIKGIDPYTQPDGSASPEGWDVADTDENWTPAVARAWAKERTVSFQNDAAAQMPVSASLGPNVEADSGNRPANSEHVSSLQRTMGASSEPAASPKTAQDAPERAESLPPETAHKTSDAAPIAKRHPKGANGEAGPALTPKEVDAQSRKQVLDGLVYTCIADVRPEAVKWLWPGRIPLGELTMIVGDPGLGKSQICASLASVVTNGGQWPVTRERAEVGSVLILSAEDNVKHTIRPRLDAAGADVKRCHTLQAVRRTSEDGTSFEGSFNLVEDLAKLSVLMDHLGDVRMVIIDPVSAYLGETDSHKNAEVRGMLAPLTTLAGSHRAAVILVSHLTKSQSTSALMRVQGSIAFAALCRAVWGVAADKDNHQRRLFMPLKNNLGQDKSGLAYSIESHQLEGGDEPIQTSRIMWESELVDMQADEAFGGALNYEERDEMRGAKEFLTEALADGRVRASDVQNSAKQAGHSPTTLGRAKRAMKIISEREGFGPKATYYWRLQPEKRERDDPPPSWMPD
jgi:archaellum biogenesis ATPase FlaH